MRPVFAPALWLSALLPWSACTAPDSPRGPASGLIPRTADLATRGYMEADFPRMQELASGVYSYEALRSEGEERFTTVSLVVVTDRGILVVSGAGSAEETARMVEAIGEVTDQPITHVVIASAQEDHAAGISAFPSGAVVLAHPTSAAVLSASARQPDFREGAPPVVVPTELVEEERVLELGGKEIRILFLGRAHTGGDLVVHLPGERVLFLSEAYRNRVFPALRSAYPTEWVEMLRRAGELDAEFVVPGHGFVESPTVLREEFHRYREALEQIIAEGRRLYEAGVPVEEAVAQADFGELDGWSLRESQGAIAIRRVYRELDGGLPAPGPGAD